MQPTILLNVPSRSPAYQEEIFGPVVIINTFDTEEEALHEANDTEFGLAAYFYTQSMRRAERVSRALQAGVVGVNEGAVASEAAPFGGVKESGYGREGSKFGLDDYLTIKYICQGNLN